MSLPGSLRTALYDIGPSLHGVVAALGEEKVQHAVVSRLSVTGDRRMQIALSEMVVEGILTNIPLHRELMVDARFIEGGTNIHYLEQKLPEKPDLSKKG